MASEDNASRADRMKGALWGVIVGDALGAPVHWYYNPDNLKKDYGEVTGYVDCKHPHIESFMQGMTYEGKFDILHDKAKFYNAPPAPADLTSEMEHGNAVEAEPFHYHNGLKAGDNTVDIYLFRALLRMITKNKEYREDAYLEEFKKFFTTPNNHPDTYFSVYIRRYFENLSRDGMKPYNASQRQVETWSVINAVGMIGGFPVAFLNNKRPTQATARAIHHINLTNRAENLSMAAITLCPMLLKIIDGADVESTLKEYASEVHMNGTSGTELNKIYTAHKGPGRIPKEEMWYLHTKLKDEAFDPTKYFDLKDIEFARGVSGTVCYSEYAVPTVFYLSLKYLKDFEKAVLASTNCGGDTCGRNAVLGAVMGAWMAMKRAMLSLTVTVAQTVLAIHSHGINDTEPGGKGVENADGDFVFYQDDRNSPEVYASSMSSELIAAIIASVLFGLLFIVVPIVIAGVCICKMLNKPEGSKFYTSNTDREDAQRMIEPGGKGIETADGDSVLYQNDENLPGKITRPVTVNEVFEEKPSVRKPEYAPVYVERQRRYAAPTTTSKSKSPWDPSLEPTPMTLASAQGSSSLEQPTVNVMPPENHTAPGTPKNHPGVVDSAITNQDSDAFQMYYF